MEIDTRLLVEDGSIVVIGGIVKDESGDTKEITPGLSRIPIFGGLFRYKSKTADRSQLLVFIAPRVV